MKYEIEKEKVDELIDMIKEFDKLLTERISDLYEIKGMMQARHAYVFYRKLLPDYTDEGSFPKSAFSEEEWNDNYQLTFSSGQIMILG